MKATIAMTLALAAVCAALGVPAVSQDEAAPPVGAGPMPGAMMGPPPVLFGELDGDGDGRITEAEVRAARLAQVAGMDRNADGKISEDEAVAWAVAKATKAATEKAKRQFASRDLDGDGALTAEELMAPPVPAGLFRQADADGDGAVSKAEFDAMVAEMHDRMPGHGGEGRHRGHRWVGPMGGQGMPGGDGDQ
ncbi:MAG: EF-hand domain-containing protein [Paracoccaceae bacterium]